VKGFKQLNMTLIERSVRLLKHTKTNHQQLHMSTTKLIAGFTAAVFALLAWPMPAQQPTASASKQLKDTAKSTAKFDGGPGSTINTSTRTTTVVPTVQTSSGTATSQQRQQQAIERYKSSGPAPGSTGSLKTKAPPSPVVTQPKPAPKPKPGGSVPTGG
jgi:hypothetical protein